MSSKPPALLDTDAQELNSRLEFRIGLTPGSVASSPVLAVRKLSLPIPWLLITSFILLVSLFPVPVAVVALVPSSPPVCLLLTTGNHDEDGACADE